jgi:two-component system alkaline phosphatase synthesis response regulator PhoP
MLVMSKLGTRSHLTPEAPRTYKILAADDDPALLAMLADTLTVGGYVVSTASDGKQAVEIARRERPDLVILDVAMPGIDGIAAIRKLRKDARTRDAVILLLTAVRAEKAVEASFQSGADDYIIKPFTVSHLLARVQTWLLRQQDREAQAQTPPC